MQTKKTQDLQSQRRVKGGLLRKKEVAEKMQ